MEYLTKFTFFPSVMFSLLLLKHALLIWKATVRTAICQPAAIACSDLCKILCSRIGEIRELIESATVSFPKPNAI
jgi:hypothetical protein